MRPPAGKIIGVALVILALIALVLFTTRGGRSLRELEDFKTELRNRGEKLTTMELAAPDATNDIENLARVLNLIMQLPQPSPVVMKVMSYNASGTARVAWKNLNPAATAELDANHELLLELREAVKKPGVNTAWELSRETVNRRAAAQWLAGAVMVEMSRHQSEEALRNAQTLIGLVDAQRDDPSMVNQMIRVSMSALCSAVVWELLQTNAWTEAQLARLQEDMERLRPLASVERGFAGHRARFVDQMTHMRKTGNRTVSPHEPLWNQAKGIALSLVWEPEEDERFFLENVQVLLDSTRSYAARKDWAKAKSDLENSHRQQDQIAGSLFRYRYVFSLITLPNLRNLLRAGLKAEVEHELAVTAIAIKRFELRHNHPPPDLAALVPQFLPSLPYDHYSGKPLLYRPNTNNSFVLYSVGTDGKDDGGDPTGGLPGLWDGRDAVWPGAER